MKQILRFLGIAAFVSVGALTFSCTKLNDETEGYLPLQDDNIVTLTASVNIGVSSRALSEAGVKTFAAGDRIAVVYINTGDETKKAESDALEVGDIGPDGKHAVFSVSMASPKPGSAVKYIYPATMANDDGTVNYDALSAQDGSLATLASTLDCCTFDGTLTDEAELPISAGLTNQFAIAKFSVKNDDDSDITGSIRAFLVSDGTNTYRVNPAGLDAIWVAMRPVTDATIFFSAASETDLYSKTVPGKSLASNSIYPINLKMVKSVPVVGHFLNRDGSITSTKQTEGTDESCAVIAYVGAVGHYFDKFVALALEDVYNGGMSMASALTYTNTYAGNHPVMIGGNIYDTNAVSTRYLDFVQRGTDKPSNTYTGEVVKGWRLPTVTDWRYVFMGLCDGPSASDPVGVADWGGYGNGRAFITAINNACGNTAMKETAYYSSSQGGYMWSYRFDRNMFFDYPDNGFLARAVFAY